MKNTAIIMETRPIDPNPGVIIDVDVGAGVGVILKTVTKGISKIFKTKRGPTGEWSGISMPQKRRRKMSRIIYRFPGES